MAGLSAQQSKRSRRPHLACNFCIRILFVMHHGHNLHVYHLFPVLTLMIITLQCICSYRFSVMTAMIIVPEMFQVPNKLCSGRKAECNIQGASIASFPDLCFDDSSIHGGLHCYPHILPTLLINSHLAICNRSTL